MSDSFTLITGATSGIGYELSKGFAGEGHNLILIGRNKDKLLEIKEELRESYKSVKVEVFSLDLTLDGDVDKLIYEFKSKDYFIENLVNNAGCGSYGAFKDIPMEKDMDIIDLNIRALTRVTKLLLPNMIKKKSGCIINIASTAAFSPGPYMSVYYASKAYVLSFTEGLRVELRGTGVKVMAVCPGPTNTGFQKSAGVSLEKVKNQKVMDSSKVAVETVKGFKAGKKVVIPGALNKFLVVTSKLTPNFIITQLVKNTNKK